MTHFRIVLYAAALGLSACTTVVNDDGSANPASWWPWVCADGGPAPDGGCLLSAGAGEDAGE